MNREQIEFILKYNNYLKGGTKEACVKVKDYLKKIEVIESKSSIDFDEFHDCINTLLAACFQAKDTIPLKYFCENDCRYTNGLLCPGEFNLDKNSKNICPYYKQENI